MVRDSDVGQHTASAEGLLAVLEEDFDIAPSVNGIDELTGLSLETLLAEPPALAAQSQQLTSSLSSLSHSCYSTFLSLDLTTKSLSASLESFSKSLESLLQNSLPEFQACASAFKAETEPVLRERARARHVLEQHDKIRELLDIPVLIHTCVRNGHFSEALSLAAHTASLSSLASPPPIVRSIQIEVSLALQSLLRTLLQTLFEPGKKLPTLWKAVTFLRRMEVMPDDELALAFLIGRSECLIAALDGLATANQGNDDEGARVKHLKRHIDLWREGVYDIIVQYTSIFLSPPISSAHKLKSPISTTGSSAAAVPASLAQLYTLLSMRVHHLLATHLVPTLRTHLPQLSPNTYPSFLTQLNYCATAFARVGCDFGAVVQDVVRCVVREKVFQMLSLAEQRWSAMPKLKEPTSLPSRWLVLPSCADAPPPDASLAATTSPNIPPSILASYPPLAVLTNSLLEVLNVLRLLALREIASDVWGEQERVLQSCGKTLLDYLQQALEIQSSKGTDGIISRERRVARSVGRAFVKVLVPFLRKALVEGVYGVEYCGHMVNANEVDGHSEPGEIWKEWEAWLDGTNQEARV